MPELKLSRGADRVAFVPGTNLLVMLQGEFWHNKTSGRSNLTTEHDNTNSPALRPFLHSAYVDIFSGRTHIVLRPTYKEDSLLSP
jgi:hypothetical protein